MLIRRLAGRAVTAVTSDLTPIAANSALARQSGHKARLAIRNKRQLFTSIEGQRASKARHSCHSQKQPSSRCLSASSQARAKGKQRQDDDEAGGSNQDDEIQLLQKLMQKRSLLMEKRASDAASNPALARELAELDALHVLWREWLHVQETSESLLRMATPENESDEAMRALALEEAEETLTALDRLKQQIKKSLIPVDETDRQDAIIEVRMGVGGGESSLFVGEIARMYMRFCEKGIYEGGDAGTARNSEQGTYGLGAGVSSFEVEELSAIPADVTVSSGGGSDAFREVIISVKGVGAYGILRHEAGVHRVQRIPATQNLGKIQTSTIAVIVLPAGGRDGNGRDADTIKDDIVDPKDVKLEVMRARGAGGQHVNKTESAVRLTHEPTGISVSMQDSRSQQQNRVKAWMILRARLLDRKLRADAQESRDVRRSQVGTMERHERVRTYNFPQDRVTDHRIPLTMKGMSAVLEGEGANAGGLGHLIEALLEHRGDLALADRKAQIEQDLVTLRGMDAA